MSPRAANNTARREAGTASVEFVAVVPFLLLAVLVAAQLAVAGQALWSAGVAARAGSRAALVGGDVREAARQTLPPSMRTGAIVRASRGRGEAGAVSVHLAVPRILPRLPPIVVGAEAQLGPGHG
ncbi:MAG: hypothetical protein WBM00_09570 [Solirubrobacterales bacterium]